MRVCKSWQVAAWQAGWRASTGQHLRGSFILAPCPVQSLPGEVTEHGGRMCAAVPATADGPPKGILLGSGPGGGIW